MNQKLGTFLFSFLLLLVFSCGDHPFKQEISEVNQLKTELDSIESVFKTLDYEDAVAKNHQVRSDAEELKMYARNYPEAFDVELGTLIDDLKVASKAYGQIEKSHATTLEEIKISKKQLDQLKQDLNNNVISIEEGQQYLKTEKDLMRKLKTKVTHLKQNSRIGVVKYDLQLELINDFKSRQN